MRTTLNIDDDLYAQAVKLTGVEEKTALLRESLIATGDARNIETAQLIKNEHIKPLG